MINPYIAEDPSCPECGEVETSFNFIAECPMLRAEMRVELTSTSVGYNFIGESFCEFMFGGFFFHAESDQQKTGGMGAPAGDGYRL
ncbi:jg26583 [Pararge aegeria aegeria]|uniref:Jg26583 protein n=1 Tax=Pararge aegeria aegeria TaxID=348720 RepID=A0A8S4QT30_9NEOP|nr:jg26583 [Pararge aegeria aegeria]